MKRGIFINLSIIFVLALIGSIPLLVIFYAVHVSEVNNCTMSVISSGQDKICTDMYAVLILSSFGGSFITLFAGIGLAVYLLGVVVFYITSRNKSKREQIPISRMALGMALSSAGVLAVVLGIVAIFFGINWYQSDFISACKGLPAVHIHPDVKNGNLAAGIKLIEPQGVPQQYAILSVSPDGQLLNRLSSQPNSKDPAWSPDGQQVVYAAQPKPSQPWGLYLADAQGQPLGTLVENMMEMNTPAWKADGSTLLFQRWLEQSRYPNTEIFALTLKDGTVQPISHNKALDGSARYSPDGRQIVFYSERESASEIYVMDADGTNVRRLTHNSDSDIDPAWSPDGKWIVFASSRGSPLGWNYYHIYIMAPDGTNRCQLTYSKDSEKHPVWSPNGEWIAFVRVLDSDLHMVHPDGTGETAIPFPQKINALLSLDWAVGVP